MDKMKRVDANAAQFVTEGVPCGKRGLQARLTHILSMASGGDQETGKAALDSQGAVT